MNKELVALCDRLKLFDGVWAELGDETYLIRFGLDEQEGLQHEGNNLALMDDFGVTWEPFKAYPTPCYGYVDPKDTEGAAQKMLRIAKRYFLGEGEQEEDGEA
jgi:hypothetical protein